MGRKSVSKRKSSKQDPAVSAGSKHGIISNLERAANPVKTHTIGHGEAITIRKPAAKK